MSAMLKEIEALQGDAAIQDLIRRQEGLKSPLVGELRLKCLAAISSLSDAALHPLSARREMKQALLDVQHAYSVAETLDPIEDEE